MFRDVYVKNLFIILIILSLFISGCELVEENDPQFRMYMEAIAVCDHGENCDGGGSGGGGGSNEINYLSTICENAFYGTCNNPAGIDIAEVHCSNEPNLGCSGLCYVSIGSQVCGLADAGLGDCYCLNDGVCDDTYGEPSDSPDCAECTDGETQSCNLPQVPGTCGICNAGLKTCTNEEWGICDQVVPPVAEDCSNGLDDDCDCNTDLLDADCVYTHLECQNEQCVEVDGEGFDQCSADTECIIPTYLECQNEQCIELNGTGADQCTIDLDCAAPTHLECVNEQCIEVNGEGSNQCTADNDCEITHLECIGETCAEIEGVGPDQCSINLDCEEESFEVITVKTSLDDTTYTYHEPLISGDYVVYAEQSPRQIHVRNIKEGTSVIVPTSSHYSSAGGSPSYSIHGDLLSWKRYRVNGDPVDFGGLVIYNLTSGEQNQIIYNWDLSENRPTHSIYEEKVVYELNHDLYLYDLSTESNQKMSFSDNIDAYWPVVSEKGIAFMQLHEVPSEGRAIFFYDFNSQNVVQVSDYDYYLNPQDIDGDYVVWTQDEPVSGNGVVYIANLVTGEKYFTPNDDWRINPYDVKIDGNNVVWWVSNYPSGPKDMYKHDILTGITGQIFPEENDQKQPFISGKRIVWQEFRNGHVDIMGFLPASSIPG
jgi:beta propeller repeat protein